VTRIEKAHRLMGKITSDQLIDWMQQESLRVNEKALKESDLLIRTALRNYAANIEFMQQDVMAFSEKVALEQVDQEAELQS
jgi:Fe-S cluster biosynthesis and repair protein YggX